MAVVVKSNERNYDAEKLKTKIKSYLTESQAAQKGN